GMPHMSDRLSTNEVTPDIPAALSEPSPIAPQSRVDFIRAVFADAALALFLSTVIGLIIASLAAAGLITMGLALVLLGLAWVVAVVGSFFLPWSIAHKHRAIFASLFAVMLTAIGWYEAAHYEKPLSANDVAQEVVRALKLGDHSSAAGSPLNDVIQVT